MYFSLYDVSLSEPIRRWETLKSKTAQTSKSSGKADIVCVTWSPHRASTFVAVNAQRCVFVFDLLNSDSVRSFHFFLSMTSPL
jgi:hypothetical protein